MMKLLSTQTQIQSPHHKYAPLPAWHRRSRPRGMNWLSNLRLSTKMIN